MVTSPIVARINALLAEKGISKKQFYKDCGITSATFSLWNTGKTFPREKTLKVIADYLGTTVEYLRTGAPDKKENPAGEVPSGPAMYNQLSDEDKKLIDQMIERLYKKRFGDQ